MAAGWHKKSSGKLTTSKLVCRTACRYFGFTLVTGGVSHRFTAYDAAMVDAGKEVEDMVCDGNKPTDGHEHNGAVLCNKSLYVVIPSGATVIVYYNDDSER